MVANADKCHLLTSTSEEVSVNIENEIIKKLLTIETLGTAKGNRSTFRSSHPEVLLGRGVLKICSKFTGDQPLMPKCDFDKVVLQLY